MEKHPDTSLGDNRRKVRMHTGVRVQYMDTGEVFNFSIRDQAHCPMLTYEGEDGKDANAPIKLHSLFHDKGNDA